MVDFSKLRENAEEHKIWRARYPGPFVVITTKDRVLHPVFPTDAPRTPNSYVYVGTEIPGDINFQHTKDMQYDLDQVYDWSMEETGIALCVRDLRDAMRAWQWYNALVNKWLDSHPETTTPVTPRCTRATAGTTTSGADAPARSAAASSRPTGWAVR